MLPSVIGLLGFLINGMLHFNNSFSGATALETAKSNFLLVISSALECLVVMFFMPAASHTASTTFNFFAILSTRRNSTSGKKMANGTPGKPPPQPISMICCPFLKSAMAAILNE